MLAAWRTKSDTPPGPGRHGSPAIDTEDHRNAHSKPDFPAGLAPGFEFPPPNRAQGCVAESRMRRADDRRAVCIALQIDDELHDHRPFDPLSEQISRVDRSRLRPCAREAIEILQVAHRGMRASSRTSGQLPVSRDDVRRTITRDRWQPGNDRSPRRRVDRSHVPRPRRRLRLAPGM